MKQWLPEELENTSCDYCQAKSYARVFKRGDGMQVVECAVCGLAYLNPRPKSEYIPRFYDEDYFTGVAASRGDGGLNLKLDKGVTETDKVTLQYHHLSAIINMYYGPLQNKRVLEIGCATGDLLIGLMKYGAIVHGLEISEFAADIGRKRGLDIVTGTIDNFRSTNTEKFDVILAFEVIEHVPSPKKFIKEVKALLADNGIVLISTPNYACAKRFKEKWFGFNASYEHIYYLSRNILTKMAADNKMKMAYWETCTNLGGSDRSDNILHTTLQKLLNLIFFIREVGILNTIKSLANKNSGYYPFGTGHTLLVVLKNIS